MKTLEDGEEVLLQTAKDALVDHAIALIERGATQDEQDASLDRYQAELEAWLSNAVAELRRVVTAWYRSNHTLH